LVLLEAMAMQKPVIACGTGGIPEMITHGRDGWLVKERSEEDVAAAMSLLLSDGARSREMGLRARETVCRRFTPLNQCTTVVKRYASLVAAA
jgi:glycosyltransferase involved in cell wall biosynthesis